MSAQPKTREQEKRTLHILYWIGSIAFVFFFCTAWLVRWVADVERFRPSVITILERLTDHPVSLEEILLAPTEGLFTLELRNLKIHAKSPAEPALMIAKKVQVGVTPSFFFIDNPMEAPWKISSLTFTNPQINLVQQEDTWLARLVQESVEESDRRMRQQLGWGLTNLAIQTIKVHNGMLTLLDWEHATGRSLVFDRIQGDIHALSAAHASPVSVSARFQSVPFTLAGQVGPLPESLDLADMPLLLNLEAKSTQLSYFIDFFTNMTHFFVSTAPHYALPRGVEIRGARGYFSTLFNGSLKKGLQTRSRLELDKLTLVEASPPTSPALPSRPPIPSDLALRQKSILKDEQGSPLWQIEECFLYMDGKPILDVKGLLHDTGQKPGMESLVNLTVSTLNSVDLDRFSRILFPFLSADSPQGTVQIQGAWPNAMRWNAHLDLSQTALSFPMPPPATATPPPHPRVNSREHHPILTMLHSLGIEKQAGIPLRLDLEMVREEVEEEEDVWLLKELIISRPSLTKPEADNPEYRLRLSGTLQPTVDLEISGEWELSLLKEYLPQATPWNIAGLARLETLLILDPPGSDSREEKRSIRSMDGQLRVEDGRLADFVVHNFSTHIKQEKRVLKLSEMEVDLGLGRLDGHFLVDLADTKQTGTGFTTYQGLFAFAGIALEKLTEATQSSFVGLSATRQASKRHPSKTVPLPASKPSRLFPLVEGVAFGQGAVRGQLDDTWQVMEPTSGQIHLEIEPGRIMDVDAAVLLRAPVHPQVISGKEELPPSQVMGIDKTPIQTGGVARKSLYWDRLTTDLLWHNSVVLFDNLQVHSGGLLLTGNGEWRTAGSHRFELLIQSPLKQPEERFAAWLEGDARQTLYKPGKESKTDSP